MNYVSSRYMIFYVFFLLIHKAYKKRVYFINGANFSNINSNNKTECRYLHDNNIIFYYTTKWKLTSEHLFFILIHFVGIIYIYKLYPKQYLMVTEMYHLLLYVTFYGIRRRLILL